MPCDLGSGGPTLSARGSGGPAFGALGSWGPAFCERGSGVAPRGSFAPPERRILGSSGRGEEPLPSSALTLRDRRGSLVLAAGGAVLISGPLFSTSVMCAWMRGSFFRSGSSGSTAAGKDQYGLTARTDSGVMR